MRVVFMGTPDFAVPTLDALTANHDVVAVITQPDRPSGRGNKLTPPPVKKAAQTYGIPVYQFEKLNSEEGKAVLHHLNPEVIVVVAYGQILKPWLLDFPKFGCLNVHASLLPRWRGAAPIHWAIVEGDSETGVTIMQMDPGLDTGDMLLKVKVPITPTTTYASLHDQLMMEGGLALIETLAALESGQAKPEKQDDALSTYAKMLSRDMALIDWSKPMTDIDCLIRGFNPWPAAFTLVGQDRLKVFACHKTDMTSQEAPGTIVKVDKAGIYVATGQGVLCLDEVQAMGAKRMAVADYLLGHDLKEGVKLG